VVVTNKAHREGRAIMETARGHHSGQTRLLRRAAEPDAQGRTAQRLLVQVNNNLLAAANQNDESYFGYRNPDNFTAVSDAYPSVTARAADLILTTAMWVEKEGAPLAPARVNRNPISAN
jgi:nitrate reductase NapA